LIPVFRVTNKAVSRRNLEKRADVGVIFKRKFAMSMRKLYSYEYSEWLVYSKTFPYLKGFLRFWGDLQVKNVWEVLEVKNTEGV
jgi:hypothetical protein